MTLPPLPQRYEQFRDITWDYLEPYASELLERPLTAESLPAWLTDWSTLQATVDEVYQRLYVEHTTRTADEEVDRRYQAFFDQLYPRAQAADQQLKEKLLASGLTTTGFEVPLRNLRAEAGLFREENLPLLAEEQKLVAEYDRIIGAQTVSWDGQEVTVSQLRPVFQELDRGRREQAWRVSMQRSLQDRAALNDLWTRLLPLRRRLAANAGEVDYRAFRWRQLLRFDYTPDDARRFHDAIEEAVVPAARRLYQKRQQQLGLETLRPWDTDVDPLGREPLRPFQSIDDLRQGVERIFHRVDPALGQYFTTMINEGLLDLDNRKNKAPGAYCTNFSRAKRPFIFANAVGLHDDVQTLLHEGGHAFHFFEMTKLPYFQQMNVPMEFAEVASMGMELLAAPYLGQPAGGFYPQADANRAFAEHLEHNILFWPYMAVVDAFQHWAYTNADAAMDPAACDAQWSDLWRRFMPGVDWTGLEAEMATGWHRKVHIYAVPFYYVEYGLAQLGAVQVWANARRDQKEAVTSYLGALALGATRPLPELYQAAGARLAFDAATLRGAVELIESVLAELEG